MIQGYKGTGLQGCRVTRVQGYKGTGLQGCRVLCAEELGNNFHRACQVMSSSSGSERSFRYGVKLAQDVQKAVIRQGVAVIQQRLLTNAGKFRYAYLSNMSDGDLNFFRRPALLSRLAHWLIAALLSKNRKRMASNDLPVVLCVLDEERQVYICVGTPGPKETRNRFGEAFRKAADTIVAEKLTRQKREHALNKSEHGHVRGRAACRCRAMPL